jgi:hypothetical protein
MIKLYQTRNKWRESKDTEECFMFLIKTKGSFYYDIKYVENVWWRNGVGWSINNYQDTFIGELQCEQ